MSASVKSFPDLPNFLRTIHGGRLATPYADSVAPSSVRVASRSRRRYSTARRALARLRSLSGRYRACMNWIRLSRGAATRANWLDRNVPAVRFHPPSGSPGSGAPVARRISSRTSSGAAATIYFFFLNLPTLYFFCHAGEPNFIRRPPFADRVRFDAARAFLRRRRLPLPVPPTRPSAARLAGVI